MLKLETFFKQLSQTNFRLLLLDYDGTLAPFNINRNEAIPYPGVIERLQKLIELNRTEIVIVSGRSINEILKLTKLNPPPEIWGEHGFECLSKSGNYSCNPLDQEAVDSLLLGYTILKKLTNANHIEVKRSSVAFHWRGMALKDKQTLENMIRSEWSKICGSRLDIHVFDGGLELRTKGRNKGDVINDILSKKRGVGQIAYLGDDATDEDAFEALGTKGLKILVRKESRVTKADIQLNPPEELVSFLDRWIQVDQQNNKVNDPSNNIHGLNTQRLVIISNRLPIVISKENDKLQITPGSGGLVTALAPVLRNRGGLWIGWPGTEDEQPEEILPLMNKVNRSVGFSLHPVFLTKNEVDLYYYGCSNEVIWPLFHDLQTECKFKPEFWEGYQHANQKFAESVIKKVSTNDFIWIHDYQLLLLGQELKKMGMTHLLSFFLHIPFPPLDIFLKLPWRFQLLRALIDFDFIGFQTARDVRNFSHCVRALLPDISVETTRQLKTLKVGTRQVRIGAFPISIDYNEFMQTAASQEVGARARVIHDNIPNQKIIFSLDRLDYTKGILSRFEAVRYLLKHHPELHQKISFIQVVVPSRTNIPEYQKLKNQIDQIVGEINSEFTKEGWIPIQYIFRSLNRRELVAHYRTSEIVLVTSIKDGMNLVVKEYIASNIEEDGVVILSEFAGAAGQLQKEAILINPYDIVGVAESISVALNMPLKQRKNRMRKMRRNLKKYDIFWWLHAFFFSAISKELHDFPVLDEYLPSESDKDILMT